MRIYLRRFDFLDMTSGCYFSLGRQPETDIPARNTKATSLVSELLAQYLL